MLNYFEEEINILNSVIKEYSIQKKEECQNAIINKLRENKSYEITKELLCVISNIIFSIEEEKIFSLIDSDLIPFYVEFLMTIKEPYLLIYLLKIIELILFKGDPNVYVDCYHKNADDKSRG